MEKISISIQLGGIGERTYIGVEFEKREYIVGEFQCNERYYESLSSLTSKHIKNVTYEESIYEDIYGNKVYYVKRKLPTFDVHDRMYGSREEQYLMYDGKSVHLISVYSGYQMGSINFYQNLIAADAELLPYFEMLEWPIHQVVWNKKRNT